MLVLVLVLVHPSLHPPPSLAPLYRVLCISASYPAPSQLSTLNSHPFLFPWVRSIVSHLWNPLSHPHLSACLHYVGYIPRWNAPT
ncbi:hypothetical protein K466DRAFT_590220 [Polyporus arcularius HHB13444]|uniref:Secreted protein n=1 Tax=Polyporus arcularius HHB13444 TaxID=1314778 RepID=A0A5C3P1I3_9APHY|nr:hypothetical protein K466DRAFT_590220 [Polyporus arcularius HHB13444]